MEKILKYLLSIIIVIFFSLISFETVLLTIPAVYRFFPVSEDTAYVYILGESSSVGEPYSPKISYYKILDYISDNKINNKRIEFIVVAQSGDRLIGQYWKYFIYRYLHPFRKGIVLVYGGKNDWDNGSEESGFSISLKCNVYSVFNDLVFNKSCFRYAYEKIILLSKRFGDDIIVSTICGNYAGFAPHLSADGKNLRNVFNKMDTDILNGNYEETLLKLENLLLDTETDKSWIYYRIGKIYEFTGRISEANDCFVKSAGFYYDLRPVRYQNEVIEELADKYNIALVDIFEKIYNSGEIIGFNFYTDNQHPNLKTYAMIAELFADVLKSKYNMEIKKYDVSEEGLYGHFNFNKIDKYNVYRHSLDVTLIHSKENDNSNKYVYGQVDEYLKKITDLSPYEPGKNNINIAFYEMMAEALKGNKDEMTKIYNSSGLAGKRRSLLEARSCDWEEYNKWVSAYLGIENFFDLSKRGY